MSALFNDHTIKLWDTVDWTKPSAQLDGKKLKK
jgi:hypothetical protein